MLRKWLPFIVFMIGSSLRAQGIDIDPVVTGLEKPVAITHAGDSRLFITLKRGLILIWDRNSVLPAPFLDLTSVVDSTADEQGLYSVAFHPDYQRNGFFYVCYTDRANETIVARYSRTKDDSNRGDPDSARVLLRVQRPRAEHYGGQLQFGPDGYLYISSGDGGIPPEAARDPLSLLGKILRIDVTLDDVAPYYRIPSSNPFANVDSARGEIWASGLRNPWRFSFDRETRAVFIADVGNATNEEIDVQPPTSGGGEDYGWPRMEGLDCFVPAVDCQTGSLVLPVLTYNHSVGCSVIGGYRYRGRAYPRLNGIYFYGDFCKGWIWGARQNPDGTWSNQIALDTNLLVSAFGEDVDGELFVADYRGTLYSIREVPPRRRAVGRG